jgi:hypothetical protein
MTLDRRPSQRFYNKVLRLMKEKHGLTDFAEGDAAVIHHNYYAYLTTSEIAEIIAHRRKNGGWPRWD